MAKATVNSKNFGVLILAGGLGTRMKSDKPKVLHAVCGKPLLGHIIEAAVSVKPRAVGVVIGHQAERVAEEVAGFVAKESIKTPVIILNQKSLTGSGQAVKEAAGFFSEFDKIFVLCGDAPLISPDTLAGMLRAFAGTRAAGLVLTAKVPDPKGYGRIVRDANNEINQIVEDSEASPQISAINEINSGTYIFDSKVLASVIGKLKAKGPKKEYMLTDVVELIKANGLKVLPFLVSDHREVLGINSRKQLAEAGKIMRAKTAEAVMVGGVTLVDPETAYIERGVKIGTDTVVGPQVFLQGRTVIGNNCRIDPHVFIKDCEIGDNVEIRYGSYLTDSAIAEGAAIGPYAHIRPGCAVGQHAKVGNFTELKAAKIGYKSKVPHLSYVGDSELGKNVNIGAGTITCNYDGLNKHKTIIGDGVFVGSNANLVAPVSIGAGAKIGAGSTITYDVPANSLAIARARQIIKPRK